MTEKKLEQLKLVDIVKEIVSIERSLPILQAISDSFKDEKPEYQNKYEIRLSKLNSLYQEIGRRNQYS